MVMYAGYIYTQEGTTAAKLIFRWQNRNCKGNQQTDVFLSD
jgi:hypothetical protein